MTDLGKPEFSEVVDCLEARARHLVAREARVGQSTGVTGGGRIGEDELQERLIRLRGWIDAQVAALRELAESIAGGVSLDDLASMREDISTVWPRERIAHFSEPEIEDRLHRSWETLGELLAHVEQLERHVRERLGGNYLDRFHGLSPEEIDVLLGSCREFGGKSVGGVISRC